MKTLIAVLVALPEIVKLIKNIEDELNARKQKSDIKQGLEKINEAFENRDADTLNRLFAND